jgi:2-alkyl-3-oxoalkanoate reductase
LITRLLDLARRGRLVRVGAGNNLIDAVYVENAAHAHLQAADHLRPDSPVAGQAYFITNGEPVNCWDWINQILTLTHLPPVQRSISFRTAWSIGAVMETTWKVLRLRGEPPMTRFLAAELSISHYFDICRARQDLRYQPQISMMEGMRRLAAWFETTDAARPR